MINDLDDSLRSLVQRDALNGSGADISFEAPTKEWAARRSAPVVDLYLYDIREDLERRDVLYERTRDRDGRTLELRPPPRRFALSYLITAWTQRPEDEHRLLASMLACFLRFEALPADVLRGALGQQLLPVYCRIAIPPADERSISDLWTALGGELKPSLDLVVTLPFDAARAQAVGPPVLEPARIVAGRTDVDAPKETRRARTRRSAAR